MILTDLWLCNFRNHKKLHIKLKTGVTGITGDNAVGKSSIIEAIQFLLTGELFDSSTKEQAINVDAASGYVAGAFVLNGKVGRIERHLDVSKTVLKFDNREYKKAGEVQDLWDKLLQLNSEIIKKVVIAKQGQIPLLFSGDEAIREQVFQKIFLVPPTNKIRAMLWKDYIKQAPPVFPEEDLLALKASKDHEENELKDVQTRLAKLQLLTEDEVFLLKEQLGYLNKCIDDAGKHGILSVTINDIFVQKAELQRKVRELYDRLSLIKIDQFEAYHSTLLQQRVLFNQKESLLKQIGQLSYPFDEAHFDELSRKLKEFSEELNELANVLLLDVHEQEKLKKQYTVLSEHQLNDCDASCPTCNRVISNLGSFILEVKTSLDDLKHRIKTTSSKIEDVKLKICEHKKLVDGYVLVKEKITQLTIQLEQFKNISFDNTQFEKIADVISSYKEFKSEHSALSLKYDELDGDQRLLQLELSALAEYKGSGTPTADRQVIFEKLTRNTEDQRDWQQLSVALHVKQNEIRDLATRIANAEINHEKNKKRNEYINTLNKVYDVLHTSQFPRKLVLSYADVVTEYLQENLELFGMPYTARVSDTFKIELLDENNNVLPKVSGGQEMQVGLSLHLALHDLFSQSFPLMIIDEGTTHLDSKNRKAYFEVIKNLKVKNKLKQILIIDHDPQLSEVVDNVIHLTKE